MPLATLRARVYVTADTNNVFSAHQAVKNARGTQWIVRAWCAAAVDATITINDGVSDVVSGEILATHAAGSTGPVCDYSTAQVYTITTGNGEAPQIDIVDGTNGEIVVELERVR